MAKGESEQDRWIRIREQQLAARDPLKGERRTQRRIAEQHRRSQRRFSLGLMLEDIPYRLKGAFLGAILGGVLGALMPLLISAAWVDWIWIAAVIIVSILGFLYGGALDAREQIKDALRR
jgi:hypothetical protein